MNKRQINHQQKTFIVKKGTGGEMMNFFIFFQATARTRNLIDALWISYHKSEWLIEFFFFFFFFENDSNKKQVFKKKKFFAQNEVILLVK